MNRAFFSFVLLASAALLAINARSVQKSNKVDKVAEFLLSTDTELLDDKAKSVANDFIREYELGSSSHFCCKVPARNETVEIRTKTVTKNVVVSTQTITGYKPCNMTATVPPTTKNPKDTTAFPWCTGEPIYTVTTHMGVEYEVESYAVNVVTFTCAPENLICCTGYTMVLNQCVSSALVGNLQGLIDLGLIG